MEYKDSKSARLFQKHDGMFVYLSSKNNWGKESLKAIETNDPIEAARYSHDYRLSRHVDTTEGEWVTATIETTLSIKE